MIAVWDDHEIANDTWRGGAENHDPAAEGKWANRATAGRRAWLEWLPIRHTDPDDWFRINRRLQFGRNVDLWMLDERRFRTKPPKSLIFGYGSFDPAAGDPDATMLGDEQQHWLVRGLRRSKARWKVLGNQVPFFPQILLAAVPGQITSLLGPLAERLEEPVLQLYAEDWNGYLDQRQEIVDGMAGIDGVVVLTGDVHQSFASEIPRKPNNYLLDRKSVAVEFVTPGVASPSTQAIINQVAPGVGTLIDRVLETNLALANPWVKYSEGFHTGCMIVDFDRHRAQADWYLARNALDRRTRVEYAASWQTRAGTKRLTKATSRLRRGLRWSSEASTHGEPRCEERQQRAPDLSRSDPPIQRQRRSWRGREPAPAPADGQTRRMDRLLECATAASRREPRRPGKLGSGSQQRP